MARDLTQEEALTLVLRELFLEAKRRYAAGADDVIEKDASSDAQRRAREALRLWRSEAGQVLARARYGRATRATIKAARQVGAAADLDGSRNVVVIMRGRKTRIRVLDHLRASGEREAEQMASRLEERLRSEYARIIRQGGSLEEAEAVAMRIFDVAAHRAEVIARDQLAKASKEGRQLFAEPYADMLVRRWRTSGDERVRDSHEAMEGVLVRVDEPWIVDYSLDSPRNPMRVPEMIPGESKWGIQCRCDFDLLPIDELAPEEREQFGAAALRSLTRAAST